MTDWRDMLGDGAEEVFGRLAGRLRERFGDPLAIVAYRGYGSAAEVVLRGRVLEVASRARHVENDSIWANLLDTYRRFETDEVPDAVVLARMNGAEHTATTDKEGFFEARIALQNVPAPDRAWHPVELALLSPRAPGKPEVRAAGEVFVPQPAAAFGVISDIDDTVVQTDATNLVRAARAVFLGSARTRLPFPGVAGLYRALHAGTPGPFTNPIFYVSSGPWNLYDMLSDFFELQGIPYGPMFLRDWGITPDRLPIGHQAHKLAAIREVLDFYPALPFVLLGDSGQEDPEIYAEIVRHYPQRILAIYIRSVDPNERRIAAVQTLIDEVNAAGSTLILADDTRAIAEHAAEQGWIAPEALADVAAETYADKENP